MFFIGGYDNQENHALLMELRSCAMEEKTGLLEQAAKLEPSLVKAKFLKIQILITSLIVSILEKSICQEEFVKIKNLAEMYYLLFVFLYIRILLDLIYPPDIVGFKIFGKKLVGSVIFV